MDPEKVIEQAQRRSGGLLSQEYVANPGFIAPGKNRFREAREEAMDGINHLLFFLQEHDFEDEDRRQDALIAMRFFLLAYDRLREF